MVANQELLRICKSFERLKAYLRNSTLTRKSIQQGTICLQRYVVKVKASQRMQGFQMIKAFYKTKKC